MSTPQKLVYDAIGAYWQEKGYAPSLDDIANRLGRPGTRGAIQQIVERLVRKGFVSRAHGIPRSLRCIPESERASREQTNILERIAGDVKHLSPEAKAELRAKLAN